MIPTLEEQKRIFRHLVGRMEKRSNKNFTIEFHIINKDSDEIKSEYDVSQWNSVDMKTPTEWLNACFFSYDMGEFGEGQIAVRVRVNDAGEAECM
jgi:hypothetical protein